MAIKRLLDDSLRLCPYGLGRALRRLIPFESTYRRSYRRYKELAASAMGWDLEERKAFIARQFAGLFSHAYEHIAFFKSFYAAQGLHPGDIQRFEDIARVPLLRKSDLKKINLDERTDSRIACQMSNSGGTTGEPLQFCLDEKYASGREWAHMEAIWKRIGYRRLNLRLRIQGRKLSSPISYAPFSSEILVNPYSDPADLAEALMDHPGLKDIRFIHGYPGLIHDLTRRWLQVNPGLIRQLKAQVVGVLFSSEFPSPPQRRFLENVYAARSISWYGHSEMAVLAGENEHAYAYEPMLTYGYAEAVEFDDGYHLVATGWDNYAHPFIRYDTEDLIRPHMDGGLMVGFNVVEGRNSEFILDRSGEKVFITGLIFGQHHDALSAFENLPSEVESIQVSQARQGHAVIHVTTQNSGAFNRLKALLSFDGIDMGFEFRMRPTPYRAKNGKTPLLIPKGA